MSSLHSIFPIEHNKIELHIDTENLADFYEEMI